MRKCMFHSLTLNLRHTKQVTKVILIQEENNITKFRFIFDRKSSFSVKISDRD